MKKSIVYLLHIGLWACYLALVVLILGVLFQHNEDRDRVAYFWNVYFWFAMFPSLISFYAYYLILFPKYLRRKKIALSVIAGLIIALTCALATYSLTYVFRYESAYLEYETPGIVSVGIIFCIALASGMVALILKGFITWVDEIKLKEHLVQRNHEMEMALVKAQLDPHFLFNTINNIDVLILKDAETASAYLNKLSDILRFMLYEAKPGKISLAQEIAYIEKYIALQKIRTSNTHYVQFAVTGEPNGKTIAPMTLIPFIENAFKHAADKKMEGAIAIDLDIREGGLNFICRNRYNSNKPPPEHNGLGVELIDKRLKLIYPGMHKLHTFKEDDHYHVHLTIDYETV